MGRFTSSDTVYDEDAGLQGYNLFVYCGNNPLNRIDISGTDSYKADEGEGSDDEVKKWGAGSIGSCSGLGGGSGWDQQDVYSKIEEILRNAKNTTAKKGKTQNYEKSGGYDQAAADFNYTNQSEAVAIQTQYGSGLKGQCGNATVILRPGSRTGGITLEFQISSRNVIKIRYQR